MHRVIKAPAHEIGLLSYAFRTQRCVALQLLPQSKRLYAVSQLLAHFGRKTAPLHHALTKRVTFTGASYSNNNKKHIHTTTRQLLSLSAGHVSWHVCKGYVFVAPRTASPPPSKPVPSFNHTQGAFGGEDEKSNQPHVSPSPSRMCR